MANVIGKSNSPLIGKGIPTNSSLRDWTERYTNYSMMHFPSWKALEDFAKEIETEEARQANSKFKEYINQKLSGRQNIFSSYGLNFKQPQNYEAAMQREEFIYLPEYLEVKVEIEKKIYEWLRFDSVAETMKPKLVYNDKQIGEFIFPKAAMSLKPKLFYYSPSKKIEIDINIEKLENKNGKMFLLSDGSEVVFAYKVKVQRVNDEDVKKYGEITKRTKKIDGEIFNLFKPVDDLEVESQLISLGLKCKTVGKDLWVRKEKIETDSEYIYIENTGEDSLKKATKKGLIQVKSDNKKVYLYKEKKPKVYDSIKLLVGLTAGGFTEWINDFYTGVTAVILSEVLESLGYSVSVVVAVGGGRCSGCTPQLNFNNTRQHGRRFFTFTAKEFGEQIDRDGLLKTVADPSFHNIKWISYMNNFFSFFGDQLDVEPNPSSSWHGISHYDMENPIGTYQKALDYDKGNKNLLNFQIHQVTNAIDKKTAIESCLEYIKTVCLTTMNINKKAAEMLEGKNYDL